MKLRIEGESPPYPLVKLFEQSNTRPGVDFKNSRVRVTSLIDPAWQMALEYEHYDKIEMTPHQLLMALLGTAFHHYMESVEESPNEVMKEIEVSRKIDGWQVVGHLDRYHMPTRTIVDWKITTATKIEKEEFRQWEEQLNIYAYLLSLPVKRLRVYYGIRDYSPAKRRKNPKYPPFNQGWAELRLWGKQDQLDFIKARLEKLNNMDLEPCTDEERWKRPDKWALMEAGKTRAIRLYDSELEAQADMIATRPMHVESRPGIPIRCQSYCNVAQWCIHRDK